MHLFWTSEIIGDLAINICLYILSITSFLKLIFVAVVVFSQKELRLPSFGKIWLSAIDIFYIHCITILAGGHEIQVNVLSYHSGYNYLISTAWYHTSILTFYGSQVFYKHTIRNTFYHFFMDHKCSITIQSETPFTILK